ncbi:hypothetical protein AB0J47_04735 [Nocardia sp. NPDC049737]|uniref:hypothetical protein n=1 Tax=Nocardia sp. NPDC049737 TaxID=3154358 RepID=UPI00343916E0
MWLGDADARRPDGTDEFVEQATEFVWRLMDGFLRRQGISADPDFPSFTSLAAVNRARRPTG